MKNEKKVVFITGASKGIGLETARLFIKNGYIVYGAARKAFNEEGVISLICDVTDENSVINAVDKIIASQGRLDVLINNAGMGISGPVEYTSDKDARYIFDVNFFGTINTIKHCTPHLRATCGRIINLSSVASRLAIPFQSFYSSTKSAVDAMSYALRAELKPFNIGVTLILPGDTKTEFTANRQKKYPEYDEMYRDRIAKSISVMEKDEQNGMPSSHVAKVIYKSVIKKKAPLAVTVGFKYKAFLLLDKFLPKKLVNFVIAKMYGWSKKNISINYFYLIYKSLNLLKKSIAFKF